ncbi:unnamed protein product [Dibothriocephalus latus]|uniref:Uncharacterized protein n=1 Tax=Dibothriocephalus latus TaxID=60516 RepID=A0A3P7LET3_DIBLA|nr:unnamed protein product [Dibothriocephalus latus]
MITTLLEGPVLEAGLSEAVTLVLEPLPTVSQTISTFADTEAVSSIGEPFAGIHLYGIVRDKVQFQLPKSIISMLLNYQAVR